MNDLQDNNAIKLTIAELDRIKDLNDQLQEDVHAAAKSKDTDDPFESAVYGPPAMILARFFIRIGWSANAVTLLSLFFGVAGSFFFYPQNTALNLVGILLELFAVILDCSDGQVARISNSSSQLGRFLDGFVDTANFFSVYIALAFRMMNETIPFTDQKWGFYIWIVLTITGLCHAEQARMADYYRGLHLHFLDHNNSANFTRSDNIRTELSESRNTPLYNRIYLTIYYFYTKAQERRTPKAQALLTAIRAHGGSISKELSDDFTARSRRYIQLTNILTFNIRAFSLYILVLLKLHHFYAPIIIIGLGGVMVFMIRKYEKIAEDLCSRYFPSR